MENNYCALVKTCVQVSPDDWETAIRTMEVTEATTMKQIADWYKNVFPKSKGLQLTITKLENELS